MSPTGPAGTPTARSTPSQWATGCVRSRPSKALASASRWATRALFVAYAASSARCATPTAAASRRNCPSFPQATASCPSAQASVS